MKEIEYFSFVLNTGMRNHMSTRKISKDTHEFVKFLIISQDFSISAKKKENGFQLSYVLSIGYLSHFSNFFLGFESLSSFPLFKLNKIL